MDDLNPILSKISRTVAAIKSLIFALFKWTLQNICFGYDDIQLLVLTKCTRMAKKWDLRYFHRRDVRVGKNVFAKDAFPLR